MRYWKGSAWYLKEELAKGLREGGPSERMLREYDLALRLLSALPEDEHYVDIGRPMLRCAPGDLRKGNFD